MWSVLALFGFGGLGEEFGVVLASTSDQAEKSCLRSQPPCEGAKSQESERRLHPSEDTEMIFVARLNTLQ